MTSGVTIFEKMARWSSGRLSLFFQWRCSSVHGIRLVQKYFTGLGRGLQDHFWVALTWINAPDFLPMVMLTG